MLTAFNVANKQTNLIKYCKGSMILMPEYG